MSLRLPGHLADDIRRHGETAYPAECCGVLAGATSGSDGAEKEVTRLVPVANRRTDDPHRYLIAADDLRRIGAELAGQGLEIVGYYHSHPDHPAEPSAFDKAHAWPWYSYVIVRVDGARVDGSGSGNAGSRGGELASWVLDDDRPIMHSEPLEVFSEV